MSTDRNRYGAPETRHRILDAAWALIETRSASVRLADVAERAGVSRQAVYLHFGDRAGLLIALVQYMDEALGLKQDFARALDAPTGEEALKRFVALRGIHAERIDPVARFLEAAQFDDADVAAAWRDRMDTRRAMHRAIVQRISDDGHLAGEWTVESASDLVYTLTMQGPWRELTGALGWSRETYTRNLTRLLHRGILD